MRGGASSNHTAPRLRVAAALCLLASAVSACRPPAPPVVTPGVGLPRSEPVVRVGLAVGADSVVVSAPASFTLTSASGQALATSSAGEIWTIRADANGRLVARRQGDGAVVDAGVLVNVAAAGGVITIDRQPYRGGALVRADGPGRVTAINVVELEEYLLGVVPAEIPATALEAVKAQAVAARTYAVRNLGRRDALGFDFFATVQDQVYAGIAAENEVASRAVRETAGEVILHDGVPILAYYHSTCGGRTAAIEEVWNAPPLPYLRSVSDAIPGTGRAYCDISSRYRWEVTWSADQLRVVLEEGLREHLRLASYRVARVDDVQGAGRTPSGRMAALRVAVDGVTHTIRGDSIRWILRAEPGRILNSSAILELDVHREGGQVVGATVRGAGWGHGVGMCQMGAIGRAQAGQGYREILRAYYTGTEVVRLY